MHSHLSSHRQALRQLQLISRRRVHASCIATSSSSHQPQASTQRRLRSAAPHQQHQQQQQQLQPQQALAAAPASQQQQQQQQQQQHQSVIKQQHQPSFQDDAAAAPGPAAAVVAQAGKLPNQADQLWGDPSDRETRDVALVEPATRSVADLDYLSELLAIQQSDGPKNLGFFGTRNMGMTHQKLVEILSYAMVSSGNHIFTSGATGTNAAVIKGALRAENPALLTVILPQSLSRQPAESQELLSQVQNVIEMPHNDELSLLEASRHCNREIISKVQQVICFAFHDSRLLLETCAESKESKKIVTLFYLD